jgi:hypothetical protein
MRVLFLVLALGFNVSALAKAPAKSTKSDSQLAAIEPQSTSVMEAMEPSHSDVALRVAPAMNFYIGAGATATTSEASSGIPMMAGIQVDILANNSANLSQGVQLGIAGTSTKVGGSNLGILVVPVLYTLIYKFGHGALRPYAGFSAGVTVLSMSGSEGKKAESVALPLPTVNLRPGLDFQISREVSLFVEAQVGIATIIPIFSPSLGVSIGL